MKMNRRAFLAAASTAALSGCLSSGGKTETTSSKNASLPTAPLSVPLSYSLSDVSENVIDVVTKDGIPSIDEPSFVDPGDAKVEDDDIVFGVENDGDVKAYPRRILSWHEVVNDSLAGTNVAVTYCPLTGTVVGYERGGTTFGVSGDLVNSNLVMYDRDTDSRWSQVLGAAVEGTYKGRSLREFEVTWTTWGRWRDRHPETKVLSRRTGYARDYESDPYGSYSPKSGYYANDRLMFEVMEWDERFGPKRVFVGARSSDGAVAFGKSSLRDRKVMTTKPSGNSDIEHTAFYDPELDVGHVYRNPEARVFDYDGGEYVGPDGGRSRPSEIPLEPVNSFDAMWFAWSAFYPRTGVET